MPGWSHSTQLHCKLYVFDKRFLSIFNLKKAMRILQDRVHLLMPYVLFSFFPLHIMEKEYHSNTKPLNFAKATYFNQSNY